MGTPRILTDQTLPKVWEVQVTPFGEISEEIATGIANLKGFPGQMRDPETGYSDNWNRMYDPSIGRYVQSDPIGLNGGLNTYAYVGGNPLSFIDPFGLVSICNHYKGIPHTFLCTNGVCGGKHSSGSGPSLYSETSEIKDDSGDLSGSSCSDVPERDCDSASFSQCIEKKLSPRSLSEPYFFCWPELWYMGRRNNYGMLELMSKKLTMNYFFLKLANIGALIVAFTLLIGAWIGIAISGWAVFNAIDLYGFSISKILLDANFGYSGLLSLGFSSCALILASSPISKIKSRPDFFQVFRVTFFVGIVLLSPTIFAIIVFLLR